MHNGRIFKTTGDGILIEFPSAVDAVEYAVKVQRALTQRNTELPQDQRIEFRIGINLGDVIVDEGDIFGDGVNVAAHLEGLADRRGICISGAVFEQIENKTECTFENIGQQEVKNIARPIQAYRVVVEATNTETGTALSSPAPMETILSRPAIARHSTFTYKGKAVKVQEIAKELGARYVMEGSVRTAGNACGSLLSLSTQKLAIIFGLNVTIER